MTENTFDRLRLLRIVTFCIHHPGYRFKYFLLITYEQVLNKIPSSRAL